MKKMNYLYMILMFSAMFVSCNKKADRLLEQIENIVEQQPDSALKMLNSVVNCYSLSDKQEAKYALFLVRAKDCAYRDIAKDSLIFGAKDYFKKTNEAKYLALAEFYSGRVFQAQGKFDTALISYMDAAITSEKLNDDNLKGLIYHSTGDIKYKQRDYDLALDKFKLSLKYFNKLQGNYKREIAILNDIGTVFLIKSLTNHAMRDSAMNCYNQAMALTETNRDTVRQAAIRQNLGEIYLQINELDMAKQQLFQALELNPDLQDKIYLTLGKVYEKESLLDSAFYFAGLSLKSFREKKDFAALVSNYSLLSDLEEKNGNYKKASEYKTQYATCAVRLQEEAKKYNLLETEKKYNFEKLQNKLRTEKQSYVIKLLCVCLIICLIAIYFYCKQRKQVKKLTEKLAESKKDLLKTVSELDLIKVQIQELQNQKNLSPEGKARLQNLVILHRTRLIIFYKAICSYLYHTPKNASTYDKLKEFIEKLDANFMKDKWKVIYQLYEPFFDQIKDKYSKLKIENNKNSDKKDEIMWMICCLECIDFKNDETSVVVPETTKRMVESRKTDIRKMFGMDEGTDIKKFFENNGLNFEENL